MTAVVVVLLLALWGVVLLRVVGAGDDDCDGEKVEGDGGCDVVPDDEAHDGDHFDAPRPHTLPQGHPFPGPCRGTKPSAHRVQKTDSRGDLAVSPCIAFKTKSCSRLCETEANPSRAQVLRFPCAPQYSCRSQDL